MIKRAEYTLRGPYKSVSMPMIILAGIVSATFKIKRVLISDFVSPREAAMDWSSGARLNHTKKKIKLLC